MPHSLRKAPLPVLLCTTKLAQSSPQYFFLLQRLHKAFRSTTLYYKACTEALPSIALCCTACAKHSPVLFCTTKLTQSFSPYYFVLQSLRNSTKLAPSTSLYYKGCTRAFRMYYFVLQSLHKARPSTTLYDKACTKHVPVLLCTAKLAQSMFQYYFVLQRLHKAFRSTTLYYKACKKYLPVLLCTTKLAQSTSQYYFVLQSLQKAGPSTTLYCKACTKYLTVLVCTFMQPSQCVLQHHVVNPHLRKHMATKL